MSRVLLLVNHDVVIYNFRLELVERLLAEGHEVYVSSPYGKRIDKLIKIGCKYEPVELSRHGKNPLQEIHLLRYYMKLLKRVQPDIVFSYTIKPNVYGGMACQSAKIPYIANITGLGTALENPGLMQQITKTLYKIGLRKAKRVYFQNTENMQFFEDRKILHGDYALLPGSGVNLQSFSLMDYPREETIEFVFISRIMKEKGIDQYLEAAQYIRAKYPNTRFHICGFCEEAYEERLKRLDEAGVIIYHGMIQNVREVIEKTHCTVHPTYYPEGLSNVLLESAACGRPVITTDRSGCRETVDDGVNGFIIRQQDTQDLIEKIERFIAMPWEDKKAMGLAGRAKVEKEFDRQIVVDKYMDELRK